MAGVIGIGGVFIKFKNPEGMRSWYKRVLKMETNDYGVLFEFNGAKKPKGYLQLGTFTKDSDYFGAATQQYMMNFRVDNLNEFLVELREKDVEIVDSIETYSYGKFLHINDPEGNRIELWEPIDNDFEKDEGTKMPML